jgi:hypothetical protein
MSKIDEFLNLVRGGAVGLATDYVKGAKQRGVDDMVAYATARKADVERWAGLLEHGEISAEDFRQLLQGLRDGAEIRGLRVAGVELARLQRLRDALVNLVINSAVKTFIPGV